MSPSPTRRSFLGLLGAGALAGCSALGATTTCSYDPDATVDGWPLPGRDPQNTHAVPGTTVPALDGASVTWSVDWDRSLWPILVSGETLFVPGRRIDTRDPYDQDPPSAVFALDPATGDRRWKADIISEGDPDIGGLSRPAAIGGDRVYAVQKRKQSDTPNRLFAFDRSTGEQEWVADGIRDDGLHLGAGVVRRDPLSFPNFLSSVTQ